MTEQGSNGTAETTYAPVELVHRRTPAMAFHYDGTENNRLAIIAWSGGRCFETNGTLAEFWCDSPQGRRPVYAGDTVLHNRHDHYYPVGQEVADGDYDSGVDHTAQLTATQVHRIEDRARTVVNVTELREMVATLAASHEAGR